MSPRYEPSAFEQKWREKWKEANLFQTREDSERPKFYGLDFFPYPSGKGLSVGHLRNYIPTDVLCRMKYMQGFNVLHPMGWDAFGLPAENEAIEKGVHPAPMIRQYADTYKRQESLVGISYDWDREVNSSSPDFYRWTQWIFQVLYRRGLAYHGDYPANWCPKDKTVLANEEVEGGLCWRCGTPVEKKILKQWFFRITAYAERLLSDLDHIDWPEGIKTAQRNWIGRSEGVEFGWSVSRRASAYEKTVRADGTTVEATTYEELDGPSFRVFTTRIDTVFGATFCVLAPEHPLIAELVPDTHKEVVEKYIAATGRLSDQDRLAAGREKTGVYTGIDALNPFTGEHIPIWIADYVLMNYGTGAIMAVPAHDSRDYDFAVRFDLEIRQVISPPEFVPVDLPWDAEDGVLVASGEFTDLACEDAKLAMAEKLEADGRGERKVNYRLRDWLISRQRYWGCPIPIVHTEDGAMELVPDAELPVRLPDVDSYLPTDTGESPLAGIESWVATKDSQGRPARRETDTMSGFACSSWYFLRFADPHNPDRAFDAKKAAYWMPVDCYVGGAEHAVLHLLYARFWTKVLFDEGYIPCNEPFAKLQNQGMLLAPTPFRHARANEALKVGEEGIQVSYEEASQLPKSDVFWRWEKMSKSKGNVVTPDEAVTKYGADALRVYELFEAPFDSTIQWSEDRVNGAINFLHRVFKLCADFGQRFVPDWRAGIAKLDGGMDDDERSMRRATHRTIAKVTADIDEFKFNTAVAALMEHRNALADFAKRRGLTSASSTLVFSEAIESFLLLLSPIAPHTADEIAERFGIGSGFLYRSDWPNADESLLHADVSTIVIQINGKVRDNIAVASGTPNDELERIALGTERVKGLLEGLTVRKIVVVPDRIVSIVAN